MRTFTTDGPCDDTRHYLFPAASRLPYARSLIEQGAYFLIRAPGRTGKTTTIQALAAQLTAEGRHAALVCSASVAEPAGNDFVRLQSALLSSLRTSAELDLPPALRPPVFSASDDTTMLWEGLAAWAHVCPRPIVLFFDDIDTLHGAALRLVLRSLATGFSRRPGHFPWSVALVGQFDAHVNACLAAGDSPRTDVMGPFRTSIGAETLPRFTTLELRALVSPFEVESGRSFEDEAIRRMHEATAGHPWFAQALAREMAAVAEGSPIITPAHAKAAVQHLIQQGESSVEGLSARLFEPRVRSVIEPLLAGSTRIVDVPEDDLQFVRALGLVADDDPPRIAEPMHQALVPRLLARPAQRAMMDAPAQFFQTNGSLALESFLHGFAVFYATHGRNLVPAMAYRSIAPELVFLGFLFQMLESRGWADVDYGSARGRIDVTVTVPIEPRAEGEVSEQREAIVLVSRRKGDKGVKVKGLAWLEDAMKNASCSSGTLVVFDQRDKPGKRVKLQETTTATGRTVRLLRA